MGAIAPIQKYSQDLTCGIIIPACDFCLLYGVTMVLVLPMLLVPAHGDKVEWSHDGLAVVAC